MTARRGCDIALHFPAHLNLWQLYDVLYRLSDHDVDVDYATMQFTPDGIFCDAETRCENIEQVIKDIGNGEVFLDWGAMSEWEPITEGENDQT